MSTSSRVKNLASNKHIQIDKANTVMVVSIAAAAALLVFSLFAARALASQASYNRKVITEKEKAVSQLKSNIASLEQLNIAYQEFVQRPTNIIDGLSSGNGDRDGDNAKIVLDSLPSKYDFPGLVSGLDRLFSNGEYKISTLGGTDDELTQQAVAPNSPVVEIPIQLAATSSYAGSQTFLKTVESSIRPIKVELLTLSGNDSDISTSISAKTYFLPEKTINIQTKEVK